MPNLWEQMSGQSGAEAATAQQMPEQAKLQNQTMQAQLRQQQIQSQQMQRLNNPQVWKDTAATLDRVIAATTDPNIKARVQMLQQQVLNGTLAPPDMLALLSKLDQDKAELEQWKAYQAMMAGQASGATAGVLNRVMPGVVPPLPTGGAPAGGAGLATPGMPTVRAGGGNHIGVATAPDGKDHNVLLDASGNIISDLGPAGP